MAKPKKKVNLRKLPKAIKIKKSVYKTVPRSRSWSWKDGGTKGQIDFEASTIEYVPLGREDTVDTILHEILHGIVHSDQYIKFETGYREETIVKRLAAGLTHVFFENPTILEWILLNTKGLKK